MVTAKSITTPSSMPFNWTKTASLTAERLEWAFPNHKTIELANANHFFFEDAATKIVEEIGAFAAADARHDR